MSETTGDETGAAQQRDETSLGRIRGGIVENADDPEGAPVAGSPCWLLSAAAVVGVWQRQNFGCQGFLTKRMK